MAKSTPNDFVLDMLGGPGMLRRRKAAAVRDWREEVRRGLPYRSLESVRRRLGLSVTETAGLLRMPARTLARRRQAGRLDVDESDRLYRLARVAAHAASVFGSEERAGAWLQRPNRALGGEPPLRVLDTDAGARQVEEVLGRLEHGVIG